MAGKNVIELTDESFETTIQDGGTPVLVDFWAEWCAPCKRIAPFVDEIGEEFAGKLRVAKVNIDHHQQAAAKFGVQSIPTLLIFKGGELVKRITGALPKAQIVEAVQEAL